MTDAIKDSVADGYIYTGVWTNWAEGRWRGATVTLNHRDGGLLTAFLALFVTVVGRSFWRLFCFAAHSVLSTRSATPQDGLYHQRQAILRNADEGIVGLKYFTQLAWNWRSRTQRLWLRILPLIGITISITAVFYVASIFSSQISTTTGNEVLISSPNCGNLPTDAATTLNDFYRLLPYASRLRASSAAYGQQCYDDTEANQGCSTFIKKSLPTNVTRDVKCPFQDGICRRNSSALRVDTGTIDSLKDLGINTAPEDRFTARYVVECSPLAIDPYISTNASNDSILYFYGKSFSISGSVPPQLTYFYPKNVTAALGLKNHNSDYVLDTYEFEPGAPESSGWRPIPELQRDDAMTTIIFLSANVIKFIQPVDDDWFSAHKSTESLSNAFYNASKTKAYLTDYPVNPLACTQQWQFCNPKHNKCTPLDTFVNTANPAIIDLYDSGIQNDTFNFWLFQIAGQPPQLSETISGLGIGALKARNTVTAGQQGPLPADQWQQEVMGWMDTSLAMMQKLTVEAATGPSDSAAAEFAQKPSNPNVCKAQKIKSAAYTSFSVLGLSITLLLGGLITLLEVFIGSALRLVQRRRRKGAYQRLEWTANELLQIQRMAHEAIGSGHWIGTASNIPVTAKDEELAVLDITDEAHPLLKVPPKKKAKDEPRICVDEKTYPDMKGLTIGETQISPSTDGSSMTPVNASLSPSAESPSGEHKSLPQATGSRGDAV